MEKINVSVPKEHVIMHYREVRMYVDTCNKVWEAATKLLREKYNGKPMTKRFTNELNEQFAFLKHRYSYGAEVPLVNICLQDKWGDKELKIYIRKDRYDFGNRSYIISDDVYGDYVTLYRQECYDSCGNINAEAICKRIEMAVDSNRQVVYRLADAAKNYDRWVRAYAKAKRNFLDAVGKINPMFVETDLRTYESNAPWRVDMEKKLGVYQKRYL